MRKKNRPGSGHSRALLLKGLCNPLETPSPKKTLGSVLPDEFLVLDLETEGLDEFSRIVEIGIVKANPRTHDITPVMNQVVLDDTPGIREHSPRAWVYQNTNLTPAEVLSAPPLSTLRDRLNQILTLPTAYNKSFDSKFLIHRGFSVPYFPFDPMDIMTEICDIYHPYYGVKWPKFQEAWDHCFPGSDYRETHRAFDDAWHEAELIFWIVDNGLNLGRGK